MISVREALDCISATVSPLPPEPMPLQDAPGHVLAADVVSGIDSPPFDKALMDGYAVRSADCSAAGAALTVIEEVTAGQTATHSIGPAQAIRIMTGAPIPDGADAVVPFENTDADANAVRVRNEVRPGDNLLPRGAAMQNGQRVLDAGRLLRAQEIGLLAELGCHVVTVYPKPRVAILATGDELVPVDTEPGPGQIRNSNEAMLAAQVAQAGGLPVPLGIARDERDHIAVGIMLGIQADMLLMSGGVSAGKLDLVPAVLNDAGVVEKFHKVNLKPGKPVWFGAGTHAGRIVPVFGLPGNPVSSLVCFELFARRALDGLRGLREPPRTVRLPLAAAATPNASRPTYHPARLTTAADGTTVELVPWVGSADLSCTVHAGGMAVIPQGTESLPPGHLVDYTPW